jgi:hypothetical protein
MEQIRAKHPDHFPAERYPDIFAEPKARALFGHFIDLQILDRYLPPIGDTSALTKPERMKEHWRRYSYVARENLFAFRKYGDPRFARAATTYAGDLPAGNLWEPYSEEALRAALADPASKVERSDRLLDGYGVAILESGEWPLNRAVALNYTSTIGHRQNDQLTLWLFARGVELLPDLGYPRTWEYRTTWDAANMAHNTVTVNERPFSDRFFENGCRLFAAADGVHVVNAYHNPYLEGTKLGTDAELPCDLYERTVVMVEVDADRFYVVDLFAANGGEQHDQSWHAMYVPPEAPALGWQTQATGTLAGTDVPEFGAYTDRWGREHPQGNTPSFITEVRRAPLDHPAVWTWRSGLPEGDALALHVIPVDGPVETIMGKGRSPVWVEDKLDYLFVRRQVEGGAPTHFLTVLDSYQNTPTVTAVRLVSGDPITLEVTRPDGVDEIALVAPPGPSRTTQHRALGVHVIMRTGDKVTRDVQIGGVEPGYAQGRIASLDYATQEVVVEGDGLKADDFAPGRSIRIFNDMRSAMYRIVAVAPDGPRLRLTLDQTALLARLPVTAAKGGRLTVPFRTPFTNGHVDAAGELTDGPNDFYYGAWLGEGDAACPVLGIANTDPPVIHLATGTGEEHVGKVITLWQYGVGDRVEVARAARA